MEARAEELEKLIAEAQQEVKDAPEGEIQCIQDKGRERWYRSIDGKKRYISQKDRSLAEALALKKYRKYQIREWTQERDLLNKGIAMDRKRTANALLRNPIMADLLSDHLDPGKKWAIEPFQSNPLYPEQKIYISQGGVRVRSKSEWMICSIYERYKIPFRYECQLMVGGHVFYPDFTVRHPQTNKIFIHEHFGMMDDPDYYEKTMGKLRIYNNNGWLMMQNLLISSESSAEPIDIRLVERMIYGCFVASDMQMDLDAGLRIKVST